MITAFRAFVPTLMNGCLIFCSQALAVEPVPTPAPPPKQKPGTTLTAFGDGSLIFNSGRVTVTNKGDLHPATVPLTFRSISNLKNVGRGILRGGEAGAVFSAGGAVDNAGLIQGGETGIRFGERGWVINRPTGRIQAPSAIVTLSSGYIYNEGTIVGSVRLLGGRNSTELITGSSISGDLLAGADAESQLILGGSGSGRYSQAVRGSTQLGGSLFKQGSGTWVIDRDLTAGTSTSINGGTLIVDSTLRSPQVTVATGGTLSGSGTIVGNLFTAGILNPGNSPGTLRVSGDFSQTSSGTFVTEIASRSSYDRLEVSGRASLDGRLRITLLDGFVPENGDQFEILTAESGVEGAFSSIEQPAVSNLSLIYLENSVILSTTSGGLFRDFVEFAETPNQRSVASALDQLSQNASGDAATVISELRTLSVEELRSAFDAISPTIVTSLPTIAITLENAKVAQIQQRLSSIRFGNSSFEAQGMPVEDKPSAGKNFKDTELLEPQSDTKWGGFVSGSGTFAKAASVYDLPRYHFETGTVTAGIDRRFGPLTIGVYSGYAGTQAKYSDGSNLRVNAAKFGVYSTLQSGGFFLDAAAGGGYNSYDIRRSIEFGSVDRTARSKPAGGEFDAFLGGGYDYNLDDWTFSILGSVQYTYVGVQAFQESGADSLNTRVDEINANSLRSSLGGRIRYNWKLSDRISLVPEIQMVWQHEFLNYAQSTSVWLENGAGPQFLVTGESAARNNVFAGAGVSLNIEERLGAYAFYNPEFGANIVAQTISAGVLIRF